MSIPAPKRTFRNNCLRLVFRLIPKNIISRWMGKLVSLKLPRPIVKAEISAFAKWFNIDLSEIKHPLETFESLQAFFIRELKSGARPIDVDDKSMVSPCDGAFGQSGLIKKGELLQIKGRSYPLSSLLGDEALAETFEGGSYCTIYLSPRDYHRFHAPFSVQVSQATYIPGCLWPVNAWAVKNIDQLFCINERIVMQLGQNMHSPCAAAMVAVGATMVGKVKVQFDSTLTTNLQAGSMIQRQYSTKESVFDKGDEMGRFEFGSTIVLLATSQCGQIETRAAHAAIKMGQRIGNLA